MGQENAPKISRRRSKLDKYGQPDQDLVLRLNKIRDDGKDDQRHLVLVRDKADLQDVFAQNTILETPIPVEEDEEKGQEAEMGDADNESPSNPNLNQETALESRSSASLEGST